jgi:putative transposase
VKRGLRPPATITTDGAIGLTQALDAVWPTSLRVRCWFHKRQDCRQEVPAQAWPEVKALLVDMRDAPTQEEGEQRRDAIVERYQREFPELCHCLLGDAEASLNPLAVPQRHQPYGRTPTLVERACVEERRRTTVIPHRWTEGSLGHLVFGVSIRVSDRWGKKCLSECERQQIRSLRERLQLEDPGVSLDEPPSHVPTRRSAASAA